MNRIQKFSILYLAALLLIGWGFSISHYRVFPYTVFEQLIAFLRGDPSEEVGAVGKLMSDVNIAPARFMHEFSPADDARFAVLDLPGMRTRRDRPRVVRTTPAAPGYHVIFGAFDFEDGFWGAVLLDSDLRLVNRWRLTTETVPGNVEPDIRKNMYGVLILPDSSIIYIIQDGGGGVNRVDACGDHLWHMPGLYHHSISLDDDGGFWTIGGDPGDFDHEFVRADIATGTILQTIDMAEVRRTNAAIHIFDLQREKNVPHAVHGNDVDPLPARLAAAHPSFDRGDLLVSFNTTNLVFVLDPTTLAVKWWRVGPWDRQHDPDWNEDGSISVFSNNMRGVGNYSNIIDIDPRTLAFRTRVAGERYDFMSRVNGMHQTTSRGTTLVTSSIQGRVFEVGEDGEIIFEFINSYDWDAGQVLRLSNALYLEPDFFDFEEFPSCAQ